MNILQRIARRLSDEQLITNLTNLTATLDSFVKEAGAKFDPESEPAFRQDVAVRDALRAEYRERTGEVI